MDPNIPSGNQILGEGFRQTYLMPTLFARLAVFFGGLAATLVAVGLGVLVVSTAAALIPARRAASVEPMLALRTE